ncbi:MAG TPA: hypothetical protein VFE46_00335 [Pirellulales bacterium]|jgi:hypothetical protein|nr:hypothetical protein [Pirellulales bacterium]
MSTFENHDFKWRETYFVLFDSARRPMLEQVKRRLLKINPRFELSNGEADDAGHFDSVSLRSPQDYAAMDISYVSGEEVSDQVDELQRDMKGNIDASDRPKLAQLGQCDAKFDILHFEQVSDNEGDEESEMLDPSALLSVMDALIELTKGVGVDPQSGSLM